MYFAAYAASSKYMILGSRFVVGETCQSVDWLDGRVITCMHMQALERVLELPS